MNQNRRDLKIGRGELEELKEGREREWEREANGRDKNWRKCLRRIS